MTGLDKIKNRISESAHKEASEKERQAEALIEEILNSAEADAEKTRAGISKDTDLKLKQAHDRAKSSSDLMRRNRILEAKQSVISEVIDKAKAKVNDLDDQTYFDMMEKIAEANIQAKDGFMQLSERDLKRLPDNFDKRIKEMAVKKGGKIEISKKPADIKGGFILTYGGIEENCTIDAIFEAKRDALSDLAAKILFS
jgi:V/A-type H+-transporting ATPase subunit E